MKKILFFVLTSFLTISAQSETYKSGEDGVRCMRDWEEIKRPTAGRWFRFIGGKEGGGGEHVCSLPGRGECEYRGNLRFLLYSRSAILH